MVNSVDFTQMSHSAMSTFGLHSNTVCSGLSFPILWVNIVISEVFDLSMLKKVI